MDALEQFKPKWGIGCNQRFKKAKEEVYKQYRGLHDGSPATCQLNLSKTNHRELLKSKEEGLIERDYRTCHKRNYWQKPYPSVQDHPCWREKFEKQNRLLHALRQLFRLRGNQ
jgi:hypothetical protein